MMLSFFHASVRHFRTFFREVSIQIIAQFLIDLVSSLLVCNSFLYTLDINLLSTCTLQIFPPFETLSFTFLVVKHTHKLCWCPNIYFSFVAHALVSYLKALLPNLKVMNIYPGVFLLESCGFGTDVLVLGPFEVVFECGMRLAYALFFCLSLSSFPSIVC